MLKKFYAIPLLIFVSSCTEEAPIALNTDDRKLVDSFYMREVSKLKPELDSLCELSFDARVQRAVDSILIERRIEIEEQMKRLQDLKAGK